MVVDIEPGLAIVRDAQSIHGHTDTLRLTPIPPARSPSAPRP
uniref:Uncharacterized protein n=1 Tax=Mycolicibacterium sp. CBMA 213 TaxID=1968788 RepID=A0A343VR08_9MYCO|nr:hypothetical protein B5P44_p00037 [Mycolicibacterium sp. CBMA 213]